MQATLSGTWELTTEHAASSYGQPVLVKRATGEAFGPADIVEMFPSYGLVPAAHGVRRLAKTASLDDDGRRMVDRFCEMLATLTA